MLTKLILFLIISIFILPVAWVWVRRINYMIKNHPDYKGYDLFDEDENNNTKN